MMARPRTRTLPGPTVVCTVCALEPFECEHVRAYRSIHKVPSGTLAYEVTVELRAFYDLAVLSSSPEDALDTADRMVEDGDEWARSRAEAHVYFTHGGTLRDAARPKGRRRLA